MTESTSEYKKRIEEIKQSIENEPYMAKMREDIAEGISKTGIRQATVEEQFQDVQDHYEATVQEKFQNIDDQFQAVVENTTGKDVISAPEIILARGGATTLGERLDESDAQLANTEEDLSKAIKTDYLDGLAKSKVEQLLNHVRQEPYTVKNLIDNGNFDDATDPFSGWMGFENNSVLIESDGKKWTRAEGVTSVYKRYIANKKNFKAGDKIYGSVLLKSDFVGSVVQAPYMFIWTIPTSSYPARLADGYDVDSPNTVQKLNGVYTIPEDGDWTIGINSSSFLNGSEYVEFTETVAINLTEVFGKGNEPSADEIDVALSNGTYYFDGERVIELSREPLEAIRVYDFYDGVKSDSEVIKDCLDFCSIFDSRIIVFDQKDWNIDEAILLSSNTVVIVDGVMIKQNDNVFDNVFRGDNLEINPSDTYGYPLSISEISNIKIIGINGAKIEGPDVNYKIEHPTLGLQDAVGDYYGWRTFQICLSKANNFEIYGFVFTKTRCWTLSFDKCSYFKVHDLEVISNVKNGDGVDIRSGCHDFEVYNISGSTSDDSVAMSAINYSVSGNYVYPLEPSKFEDENYTPEELSIYNGNVRNITTTGQHHGVICLSSGGRKVFNITINHVIEPSASMRESVVKIYSGYGSGYTANDLNNIRVNNILSKGATHAVQVTHKVDNVWFNKIRQENPVGNVSSITDMDGVKLTNA